MIITFIKPQIHNQITVIRPPPDFDVITINLYHQKPGGIFINRYNQQIDLYFELKGTPESSKESYLRRINAFIDFIQNQQRCLEEISQRDIQQYILYLKNEKRLSAGTINNYISAIKFFYTHVLDKKWNSRKIPRMKRIMKLPEILSKQQVLEILNATVNLKHKAFLALMYGSGLRVSEVAKLKIGDIHSKTMQVRVDNAKHNTNRYTILSKTTLMVLRQYFLVYFNSVSYKPDDWLFPGRKHNEHISVKTIKNTLIKIRNRLRLNKNISAHTLRHCFATHSLEDGVELAYIQQMLGHKNLASTATYLHMTSKSLMKVRSPLDTDCDQVR